jgi:hypothetical protein
MAQEPEPLASGMNIPAEFTRKSDVGNQPCQQGCWVGPYAALPGIMGSKGPVTPVPGE